MKNNELREEWADEFREYYDETLKPKKPSMKNLEREIIVDFIRTQKRQARDSLKAELVEGLEEKNTNYGHTEILDIHIPYNEGYNKAIDEAIELIKKL